MEKDNPFYQTHIICTPEDKDRWVELFKEYGVTVLKDYAWRHLYIGGHGDVLQQWNGNGDEIKTDYKPHGSFKLIILSKFDDSMVDKEEIEKFKKQLIKQYGESDV